MIFANDIGVAYCRCRLTIKLLQSWMSLHSLLNDLLVKEAGSLFY